MRRTIYNTAKAVLSLAPAVRTTSANGTAVDLGPARSALLVVVAGTVTDGTHTVSLEESANGSTGWAAVADADLQGTEPAVTSSTDERLYEVGYVGSKRYVRPVVTVTGTPATGGSIACVVQAAYDEQPVAR